MRFPTAYRQQFLAIVVVSVAALTGVIEVWAQFGGQDIETFQNRPVGAPPESIQAAIDGDLERLRRLWQSERMEIFERDQQQRSVLMIAVIHQHAKIIAFLLENQADIHAVDEVGNTALHFAALRGNIFAIDTLLERGANVDQQNVNGETALMLGIKFEQEKSVMRLLEAGADTQLSDYTARTASDYAKGVKDRKLQRKLKKLLR